MSELKDEIEAKKVNRWFEMHSSLHFVQADADQTLFMQKSLQNLEDASDDLMMCEDDALLIPYQIGDVFISHSQEETQEMLEAAKVCVCVTELVSSTEPCLSLENLVALWVKIWAGKVVDSNLTRVDSTLIIVFLTSGYCRRMYNMCTRFTGH